MAPGRSNPEQSEVEGEVGLNCCWLLSIQGGHCSSPFSPKGKALIKVIISEMRKPTLCPEEPGKEETCFLTFGTKLHTPSRARILWDFFLQRLSLIPFGWLQVCASKPAFWSRVENCTRWCKMPSNSCSCGSRPWSSAGENPAPAHAAVWSRVVVVHRNAFSAALLSWIWFSFRSAWDKNWKQLNIV